MFYKVTKPGGSEEEAMEKVEERLGEKATSPHKGEEEKRPRKKRRKKSPRIPRKESKKR